MKRLITLNWLGLLIIACLSCADDENDSRKIPIQILANETGEVSEAMAYILSGETIISSYVLGDHTSQLPFNGELGKSYKLRVVREGHESFTREFEYTTLRKELAGLPLKVILPPAMELIINSFGDDQFYGIDVEGSGVVTIVWPDGSQETHSLPISTGTEFDAGSGYVIVMKGDLQNITSFRAFGYGVGISSISGLKHLRNLKSFLPGWVVLSDRLDLRHNKKLEQTDLFEAKLPDWLILPQQHRISAITITLNDRSITASEIDLLINSIYRNAVRQQIRNGMVALSGSDNPSDDAVDKIRILEEDYGWSIDLNL